MEHNFYPRAYGRELRIKGESYAGKIMEIREGGRPRVYLGKERSFYVFNGKVLLEVDDKKIIMHPRDSCHIMAKQKCRLTGLEDSVVAEFSGHLKEEEENQNENGEKISLSELRL